jgi:hypothetical protein
MVSGCALNKETKRKEKGGTSSLDKPRSGYQIAKKVRFGQSYK